MDKFTHVFQPLKVGGLTLKNRIEMAPVGPLFGSNLPVTREHCAWGWRIAMGGAATVTLGENAVTPPAGPSGSSGLSLATDRVIEPLSVFTDGIHRHGALASIELNYRTGLSPAQMSVDEIKNISGYFAAASYRCWRAGFDMVIVHGAHGQLISQFNSPRVNSRTDAYGGLPANRARLAVEVLEAIKNKTGSKVGIEYRISADEFSPGGLKLEEQIEFARLIQDRIDLLHVSAGLLTDDMSLPRMIQPAYLPRGINVGFAATFKKELKIPVAAVGSLNLELAEAIISCGQADTVALGRALLADPDCVNKARQGRESEIRPCVRCNWCINRTHSRRLPVRCAVNPLCGREAEFSEYPEPGSRKKIVVIGGGPAGMEAGRRAAERGHNIVLFEKQPSLGGNLALASAPPFKEDMKKYLDWSVRATMNTPHLTVRLAAEASPEKVQEEKPDVLIIAAGGSPVVPDIPGIRGKNVVMAADVVTGKRAVEDSVLVAGAGLTGSETALMLSRQGKQVTLVDMLSLEEIDAGYPFINILTLRSLLKEAGVGLVTGVKLERITRKNVVVIGETSGRLEIPCDTVVLALGFQPRTETIRLLSSLASGFIAVGDCNNRNGSLFTAVEEGFSAAMKI